ncbi:MAG: ATP-binding protein [Steroidobacteraceae bacterium]
MSVPQTRDSADGTVAEAQFLLGAGPAIERALFVARFANWKLSIAGTIGIAWTFGYMFLYVEPRATTLRWAAYETLVFGLIGLMCLIYEFQRPALESKRQRVWLHLWTVGTAAGGAMTGLLPWFIPAERIDLQLSAAAIVSILMIAFVVSRGHRPLIYTSVGGQAAALCLALAVHAQMLFAVPVCLLLAGFVLAFGLMLNKSMRAAIGQRLYAQHLQAELARSHSRQLLAQQREVVLNERQRMMAELHDGFGSQLLTSQRLLESGRIDSKAAGALLRECVVDLRLMVDAHEPAARNLATLLGMLRYRLQKRIQTAGIKLHWRIDELADADSLAGAQALDLLRILQEAISNVLQHAGAREIAVTTRRLPRELEIAVEDDGQGLDPVTAMEAGRGIAGMRRRAARLGGELVIEEREGGGTALRIRLRWPLGAMRTAA